MSSLITLPMLRARRFDGPYQLVDVDEFEFGEHETFGWLANTILAYLVTSGWLPASSTPTPRRIYALPAEALPKDLAKMSSCKRMEAVADIAAPGYLESEGIPCLMNSKVSVGSRDRSLVFVYIDNAAPASVPGEEHLVDIVHEKFVQLALGSPAPSKIATSATKFKEAQDRHPVYMGRPLSTRTGPPIAIYVGAFARLRDKLASLDDRNAMQDAPRPEPFILRTVADLFIQSCELYPTEADREKAVLPLLEELLGVKLSRHHPISPGEKLAEFDAVDFIDLGGTVQAYTLVVEVKNELGIAGSSGVQCAFRYEKAVALPSYQRIRSVSCCPSILVAVAGPYVCFYGAILADTFIVQPFTDYIYLGGDPDPDERIIHTARRFSAFREAIRELRSYFRGLHLDISGPLRAARLPCPTYTISSDALRNLRFIDRFRYEGFRSDDQDHFDRSLFSAKLNDKAVLVKFCTRYGADAHRYLAGKNLAPVLHHCIELVGKVTMVVMDVVEDAASAYYKYIDRDLPKSLVDEVEKAAKALHDEGYVHGDIRRPNIMVREGDMLSVMLIDFDWAGKAGQTRYPVSLNLSGNITWAAGTEAGGLIVTGHDDHMVEMLRKGGK